MQDGLIEEHEEPKSWWARWKRKLTMISLAAGTIVSVAGALAVFNVTPPDPVWQHELNGEIHYVEQRILELDSIVTSQQLDDARLRLYQNEREQTEWEMEQGFVPNFLIQERVLLEGQIESLQRRLDAISGDAAIIIPLE
jgi:hypothetical protein